MNLERIHPRSLKRLSDDLGRLIRTRLWLKVMVGMGLGIGTGILLGPSVGWVDPETARLIGNWVSLPGNIFLALLQMIVVPLVFASVIRGLAASENPDQLRRLGLRVMAFFLVTTVFAAMLGIGLALVIRPGDSIDAELVRTALADPTVVPPQPGTSPSAADLPGTLVGLLPQNPLLSMVDRQMLQVVLFAIVIGIALVSMAPSQSKPLLTLLGSVQTVCITVVRGAMRLAPFAVFGLMCQLTSKIGLTALLGLGVYIATVLGGLLGMLVVYLGIVAIVGRRRPLAFLGQIREVLLLAFSTSSSAAVMPLSIRTADEKLRVRPSISQFVIPFGATVNMTGTAVYQSVATVFLAQLFGVELGVGGLAVIVLTAVASSVGAPATPGVGIVILATLLNAVGVPLSGIALVMGVDRILDMSRTSLNVAGDLVACVVMERWVGGEVSQPQALAAEAEREARRAVTGEDVIVGPEPVAP